MNSNLLEKTNIRIDISILRIIATLAVVFLHVNNTITSNTETYNLTINQLHYYKTLYSLMNWAVPVFMTITGALLLKNNKVYGYLDILKYLKRVLLALFLFGVPYAMAELIFVSGGINLTLFSHSITKVLYGESWGHLWYLYTLIGFYLVLPIVSSFTSKVSKKDLIISISLMWFGIYLLPVLRLYGIRIAFSVEILSDIIFYALLGCFLEKIKIDSKIWKIVLILIFLLISALTIVFCCFDFSDEIINLLTPFKVISLYMIFKRLSLKPSRIIWTFDRLCFCVYLIHPFFINIFYKILRISPIIYNDSFISIVLFWFVFSVLSFMCSFILYKIKPLKNNVL